MLDVGAVAARSGPPVAAEDESPPSSRRSRAWPPPGLPVSADTFSAEVAGGARRRRRSRSTTSAAAGRRSSSWSPASGCGYVLMHIEGPPRVDAAAPAYEDVVDHLKRWFAERIEAALGRGVGEDQIVIDPGSTSTSPRRRPRDPAPPRRASRARPPALRLALPQGLHRRRPRRLLGGPAAGRRARVGDRRRGLARGRRRGRRSCASTTAAPCRRCGSRARSGRRRAERLSVQTAPLAARDALGDPARSGPPRRAHRRRERRARTGAAPRGAAALARSRPRRGAAGGRYRAALLPPAAALDGGRRDRPDRHQRHRLGQVARLQPAGARRDRPRPEAPRPLPLPDQGAGPGPGAKARAAAAARAARGDLRRRHAARRAPGDPAAIEPRPHQSRHAPHRRSSRTTASGATSSPTSAGSWSTRPTPTAASSAPTSPTCCAACAGSPPPMAPSRASSSPRRRSPTRSSLPGGWSAPGSS